MSDAGEAQTQDNIPYFLGVRRKSLIANDIKIVVTTAPLSVLPGVVSVVVIALVASMYETQ